MQDTSAPVLSADSDSVTSVESLCMNCNENGETRLLLTNIPYFRDVLLAHFVCPHCHYENTEVQQTAPIQDHGMLHKLQVKDINDLSRQIVKSDFASINFPEIGFEIPSTAQTSSLNTLEGFIQNSIDAMQYVLTQIDPECSDHAAISSITSNLKEMLNVTKPYVVELDDPSGNSFLQNLVAPKDDPQMEITPYIRSFEQNKLVGMIAEGQKEILPTSDYDNKTSHDLVPQHKEAGALRSGLPNMIDSSSIPCPEDVVEVEELCNSCHHPSKMRMMITNIPYFKEVTIMAFSCDVCGYRSNEIKCGGGVPDKGKRITFVPRTQDDLSRSFLKSDTAFVKIPEIGIELEEGTLGSKFTTIEGFIQDIYNSFKDMPFVQGDSAQATDTERMKELLDSLKAIKNMELPFSVVIDDPMANSYIQNPYVPSDDPCCIVEEYERTEEQNSDLGLTDMVL
ncbi:Zinc finger protein [Entamoeba marina]